MKLGARCAASAGTTREARAADIAQSLLSPAHAIACYPPPPFDIRANRDAIYER